MFFVSTFQFYLGNVKFSQVSPRLKSYSIVHVISRSLKGQLKCQISHSHISISNISSFLSCVLHKYYYPVQREKRNYRYTLAIKIPKSKKLKFSFMQTKTYLIDRYRVNLLNTVRNVMQLLLKFLEEYQALKRMESNHACRASTTPYYTMRMRNPVSRHSDTNK